MDRRDKPGDDTACVAAAKSSSVKIFEAVEFESETAIR
jgi:hypothetical protein